MSRIKSFLLKIVGFRGLEVIKIILSFPMSYFMKMMLLITSRNTLVRKKRFESSSQDVVLLPLIETSHYKNIQLLLIAKGLELRGYRIVIVVCSSGLNACEQRSSKISASKLACISCGLNIKIIKQFGFEIEYLSAPEFTDYKLLREEDLGLRYRSALKDSVTRYFFGDVPDDAAKLQEIRNKYLKTLSITHHAASIVFEKYNPKILLAYMMVYVENYPWIALAEQCGIRIAHVSNTQFNETAQSLNLWDLYSSNSRYEKFAFSQGMHNSVDENVELDTYLQKRFSGSLLSKKLNLSHQSHNKEQVLEKFPIFATQGKKCVMVFPNILWDSGMSLQNTIFNSVEDWLVKTVSFLAKQDEYLVVVKCHPQERLYTNKSKTSKDAILRYFKNKLPPNVHIIDYETKISSYDLFDFMDICCVFNGTIGLEALLCGKQVIVGGKAPYGVLINSEPISNEEAYYKQFSKLTELNSSDHKINEIRRFAYFYFIKTPIPWSLTEKAVGGTYYSSLKSYNIEKIVEHGGASFDHLLNCIVDSTLIPENWVN